MIVFAFYGCSNSEDADDPGDDPTASALVFKLVPDTTENRLDTLILEGNEIQWYNESTKEVRFTDNYTTAQSISFANYTNVRFYIGSNYLFSSLMFATGINSQTSSNLVFYYSSTENRFYLKDGYPDVSVLSSPQAEQQLRDENRKMIADEWALLVNQLKLEGRYVE
ncbi:MAG: hypothetical protein H6Q14_724 [Bacteroidetes bacterium]|jgi:hypothetical protein|nr:hypothetical protein [Bacteroidota bacterium]